MQKNEGKIDRAVRVVLGLVLLYVGAAQVVTTGMATYIIALLGLILLVTGATGYCALYSILKLDTLNDKVG
ncbi:MAG: DUF2892 domain-containing protein [Methanosarcinaceae archaeon]|nr:DUF2892 domain-containing protein [Methanosarcinaceae archaeon]